MEKERRTKALVIVVLLIVVAGLTIAFAALSTTLNINGTAYLDAAKWGIKFVKLSEPTIIGDAFVYDNFEGPSIDEFDPTQIRNIDVRLSTPGDKVIFTVFLVNKGTINAKIDSIEEPNIAEDLKEFFVFKMVKEDGNELSKGDILSSGEAQKLTMSIEFKKDITKEELDKINEKLGNENEFSLSYKINFVQTDEKITSAGQDGGLSTIPEPYLFENDSWETIVNAIKNNNIDKYDLGDEKEVDMGEFGIHKVRIANKTSPSECKKSDFSETACGFVLEFSDIITYHIMNEGVNTKGGWPATKLREYINTTIYNALPEDLKKYILDSRVRSSRGPSESDDFSTTDKLYLLDVMEVYGDTSYDNKSIKAFERQLDNYKMKGITINSTSDPVLIKDSSCWWLRSSGSDREGQFYSVDQYGLEWTSTYLANGVSPAFRIGK